MADMTETIDRILASQTFAVVGASANTGKYGYKVWKMLRERGKTAFAVNPNASEIEGEPVYPTLADLPIRPDAVVAVVPPFVTETLPAQLAAYKIKYLWIQPGAASDRAVADAEASGVEVVHGGPCILVGLRTHFGS